MIARNAGDRDEWLTFAKHLIVNREIANVTLHLTLSKFVNCRPSVGFSRVAEQSSGLARRTVLKWG